MKIKIFSIVFIIVLLSACKMNSTKTDEQNNIGGQKDKHGCLTAAGYTWSYLKEKCIRPFEDGITLLETSQKKSYQVATYLILDSNKKQAEIFVPNTSTSILLNQKNNQEYSKEKYLLKHENTYWVLYIDKKKMFEEK